MSMLEWEQAIRTNLSGPFFMSKAVLGHFVERGSGRIVNISSFVGETGGSVRQTTRRPRRDSSD